MSSPTKQNRQTPAPDFSRRGALKLLGTGALLLGGLPLLAACGFKPMYGGRAGAGVTQALAQVEVARIDDRLGQMLRNALERRLERSGGGGRTQKRYLLTCTVTETTNELGLSKDSFASRADLTLTVEFALTLEGNALLSGSTQGIVAYNILDQQYATVVSEQNSRQRATEQAADDITRRLSSYFSRQIANGRLP